MQTLPSSGATRCGYFPILTPLLSLAVEFLLPLPVAGIAIILLLIPSGLAVLLAGLAEGRQSVSALLKKLLQWDNNVKWYALAIGLPFLIILAAAVVAYFLRQVRFRPASPPCSLANHFQCRLYPVERYARRGGLAGLCSTQAADPALGVGFRGDHRHPWGILHIGIAILSGRPWLPSFLIPFGLSMVITWMFVHTRSSVTLAMVLHFVFNFSLPIHPGRIHSDWPGALVGSDHFPFAGSWVGACFRPQPAARACLQTTAVDAG